ncbi:MAG: NosD domain-containing protein [Promethearchaeota archaeon]
MNQKKKIIRKRIIVISFIFAITTLLLIDPYIQYKLNSIDYKEKNLKTPKSSGYWTLNFIHINGSSVGNWSNTAAEEWCAGSGTWSDPYIIENVTIDANNSPTGSGILIQNSKNDYFIIRNCTIYPGPKSYTAGITLTNTNNGTLINNTSSYDGYTGILLMSASSNNTISRNTVNNNDFGIVLWQNCYNNTISGNTAKNNSYDALSLYYGCNNNTLSGNNVNNNTDIGIYLYSECDNNTISGNNLKNNTQGIYLRSSNNNTISGNTVNNNTDGIYLEKSSNNTILGNFIKNNQEYGITITDAESQNNTIYQNMLIGITNKYANDIGTNNYWNTINIGNYWENHTTPDAEYDGIVNNPYTWISGGTSVDNFPLAMSPIHDGEKIHIDDTGVSGYNWSVIKKWTTWVSGSGKYFDHYIIDGLEIDAGGIGSCIEIENSNVYFIIKNCTIYNSGNSFFDAGIKLSNTNNGSLLNNTCSNNGDHGILLEDNSNNNTILGNTANNNNNYGIFIIDSSNNTISGNTANNNEERGINSQYDSHNNIISGNIANNNQDTGISIITGNNHIIKGNIANNNGTYNQNFGIYLSYISNSNILGNTANNNNANGIDLESSENNTISGNTVNNNNVIGIDLESSENNTISGNTANDNIEYGINLEDNCSTNTISGNTIRNNNLCGINISTSDCQENLFYNNIINNSINAFDNGNNYWNNSMIGNSWSDYNGSDLNDDGIGDTPYSLNGVIDYLPIFDDGDSINPVIIIFSPEDYETFGNTPPSINVSITDPNLEHTWFSIQNNTGIPYLFDWKGNITQDQWDLFGNGLIIITFYANDSAGNNQTQVLHVRKRVGIWHLSPFIIDDSGKGNYTWEVAFNEGLCNGSGSLTDPYIIDNIIIDGQKTNSCLEIRNSRSYFVIRDSIFYNSGNLEYMAGLKLVSTNNGQLVSNNCSINFRNGIFLDSCENILISDNTVSNNSYNGIFLSSCTDISIMNNEDTINRNGNHGIHLRLSDSNKINFSTINYNNEYGLYLEDSSYNNITNNDLRYNYKGPVRQEGNSRHNIFSDNIPRIGGDIGPSPLEILIIIIVLVSAILAILGIILWKKKGSVQKSTQEEKNLSKIKEQTKFMNKIEVPKEKVEILEKIEERLQSVEFIIQENKERIKLENIKKIITKIEKTKKKIEVILGISYIMVIKDGIVVVIVEPKELELSGVLKTHDELYERFKNHLSDIELIDMDLTGGMLTAINSFVGELSKEGEHHTTNTEFLREIEDPLHPNLKSHLCFRILATNYIFGVVAIKPTQPILKDIISLKRIFKVKYKRTLKTYDGKLDLFNGFKDDARNFFNEILSVNLGKLLELEEKLKLFQ